MILVSSLTSSYNSFYTAHWSTFFTYLFLFSSCDFQVKTSIPCLCTQYQICYLFIGSGFKPKNWTNMFLIYVNTVFRSEWTSWSECTAKCGLGTKFRARQCVRGDELADNCDGPKQQVSKCSNRKCPGEWSRTLS